MMERDVHARGEFRGPDDLREPLGRDRELRDLTSAAASESYVEILGAPGIGKTHLARYALGREHEGKLVVVDAEGIERFHALANRIERAFEFNWFGVTNLDEAVERLELALPEFADGALLFDAAGGLDERGIRLLEAIADFRDGPTLVVTSRQTLLPERGARIELGPLEAEPAETLFRSAARRAGAPSRLEEAEEPTIRRLVEQLDRIPLALQLSARQLALLDPSAQLERLEERRDPGADPNASPPTPVDSLSNAFSEVVDSLGTAELACLRQLSVFESSPTLETVEAIVELPNGQWVAEAIDALRRRGLVEIVRDRSEETKPRVRVLSALRDYLREADSGSGPHGDASRRHAELLTSRVADWRRAMFSTDVLDAIEAVRAHRFDLLAVFHRWIDEEPALALRALLGLSPAPLAPAEYQSLDLLDRAVDAARSDDLDAELEMQVHLARGRARHGKGRPGESETDLERALAICRNAPLGDASFVAVAFELVPVYQELDEREAAEKLASEARERARRTDNPFLEAMSLESSAFLAFIRQEYGRAEAKLDRALQLLGGNHSPLRVDVNFRFGQLHVFRAEPVLARKHLETALEIADETGWPRKRGRVIGYLARVHMDQGSMERAAERAERAVAWYRERGHPRYTAENLLMQGSAETYLGRFARARNHLNEALALAETHEIPSFVVGSETILGYLYFQTGRRERAVEALQRAVEFGSDGLRSDALLARLLLAAVESFGSKSQAAARHMEVAEEMVDDDRTPEFFRAVAGIVGLVVRLNDAGPEERAEPLREAREALQVSSPEPESATELEMARELLSRAVDEAASAKAPDRVVRVGPETRWLETTDDERLDLSRRGALRRIVRALVESFQEEPGESLDKWELLEIGWPETRVAADSGAQRVYTAIWQLREAGLEELLEKTDRGYRFAPDVEIRRATGE